MPRHVPKMRLDQQGEENPNQAQIEWKGTPITMLEPKMRGADRAAAIPYRSWGR
jgi:hypothetical protein